MRPRSVVREGDYREMDCGCRVTVLEVLGPGNYRCRVRRCFNHAGSVVALTTSYSQIDGLAAQIERAPLVEVKKRAEEG